MFAKKIVLGALLVLTACASPPKKRQPMLETDVPEHWQAVENAEDFQDFAWWQSFGDAELDSVVQEALDNNFTLKMTAALLKSAEAQAKISGASLYPNVNLGGAGSKVKQNFAGSAFEGVVGGAFTTKNYGVSLGASWEIDLWGRIRSGKSAAIAQVQASRADLRGAKLSLTGQVAKAWFAAIEAQKQLDLSQATFQSFQSSGEQVRARYQRGLRNSLDLRLALTNASTAEAVVYQRQALLDAVSRQVEIVLGRYPSASLDLSAELPVLTENAPAGLPADLVARRPDLVAAERRLAATYAGISQAKKALLPGIALTASGGTSSAALSDLLNGDFSVWSIIGSILQPIFQGGRLRANVKLAKSVRDQALAFYGLAVLSAFGEVESALANEKFLSNREKALAEATKQAIAARDLAQEQYNNGLIDYITLLEAQRRAFTSESQLITVRRERLDARVNLHLALGGGFSETNTGT